MKKIDFLPIAATLLAVSFGAGAQTETAPASSTQAFAAKIQGEVAELRGLPFKKSIVASKQTPQEFGAYLEGRIQEVVPPTLAQHYGKVVKRLGLYRGPEIQDFTQMMKSVYTSQAGAYYDPDTQTFHVLLEGLPEVMLGAFYSHELYHGLQDQYFDLEKYLGAKSAASDLDGDRRLARQSVVEGEATYIMTLWTVKHMTQSVPPRNLLQQMVALQSQMDVEQIRALMQQQQFAAMVGDQVKASVDAMDRIPSFMLESMLGAYFKGMNFVFAVEEQGWPAVESLYRDRPPESTEQILHPEKWLANEVPVRFRWASTDKVAALRSWQLIDDDVLGELMWRIVFREHGFAKAESEAVAAGWNGDRYAVYKKNDSDATLLLLRTSWDTKQDADEFASAYRRLLTEKYKDVEEPTRVERIDNDVLIVEGGDTSALNALIRHVRAADRKSP